MAWNQSHTPEQTQPARSPHQDRTNVRRGLIAALIVILGGVATLVFLTSGDSAEKNVEPAQVKELHSPTQNPQTHPRPVKAAKDTAVAKAKVSDEVTVVKSHVITNATGAIIEKQVLSNGKKVTKVRPPEPIFKNAADQLIAMTLSVTPGQAMAPLPDLSNVDDDFVKSLVSPIRIEEGDSDEVKELKGKVMEARAYLREEIKAGKTVREALREYQADLEKFADSHLMAVQEIENLRQTNGDKAANEFRERINESFRARGIPELEKPDNENKRRKSE